MIDVSKYIYPELIITGLKSETKEDAIRSLCFKIFEINPDWAGPISKEEAFNELMFREKMQTTGLGQMMAFPHARIKGWNRFAMAIGISKRGINFNSLDARPVNFICLMVSSTDEPYLILQAMAALIRFAQKIKFNETLFEGMDSAAIAAEFQKHDIKAFQIIRASDIMRPVKISVRVDTPLEEVSRLMHLYHLDVLPVLGEQDKLKGQISCFEIFVFGIPDFFKHLHTVSFVRHIDPFEKYFKIKKELTVKDIFKSDCAMISHDATLLEIIFELTVKNKPKLFVIREGVLVGEIDRFSIIDKILFF